MRALMNLSKPSLLDFLLGALVFSLILSLLLLNKWLICGPKKRVEFAHGTIIIDRLLLGCGTTILVLICSLDFSIIISGDNSPGCFLLCGWPIVSEFSLNKFRMLLLVVVLTLGKTLSSD